MLFRGVLHVLQSPTVHVRCFVFTRGLVLQDTPLELRCLRGGVRGGMTDKVAMFNKHADEHLKMQKCNPFSGQADGSHMVFDKNDPNYGR